MQTYSNKKNLLIPLEVLSRDLDSRLLIALKLLKTNKNWRILIGRTDLIGDFWRNGNVKGKFIYLSKGTIFSKNYYQKLFSKKGFYFLLDEEGSIFTKFVSKNWTRGGINNDLIKYMSKIFFWGEIEKKNYFLRHKYITEDIAEVTGNPRFDISKTKYKKYFDYIKSDKELKNNFIMVDTAFGVFNNIIDIETQFDHWKKIVYDNGRGELKPNEWLDKTMPTYEFQSKLFPKFVEGIIYLAKNMPDKKILFRPHPVENLNTYKNLFKNINNIIISNEGSAVEKFINSSVLIHNGCSTAVEATLSNIPTICYLPEQSSEHVQELPRDISIVINTKEDLYKKIIELNTKPINSENFRKKLNYIKPHIDNTDYESSEKIASIINQFDLNTNIEFKYDLSFKAQMQKYTPEKILNLIKSSLVYKLITKKKEKTRDMFKKRDKIKFSNLNYDDINFRIKGFKKIDDKIPEINLIKIQDNLFELMTF